MDDLHQCIKIWNDFPCSNSDNKPVFEADFFAGKLSKILPVGPFYTYTFRANNTQLIHTTPSINTIHGIAESPHSLEEILMLVHPQDLKHIIDSEQTAKERIEQIDVDNIQRFRISYCIRMRVEDGTYHLFHHISTFLRGEDSEPVKLHVHTDLHHICAQNNGLVLVSSIGGNRYFAQIEVSQTGRNTLPVVISSREAEILRHVSLGFSSTQIADVLFISTSTVRAHRRNLLKKTATSNTSSMIKRALELGLL